MLRLFLIHAVQIHVFPVCRGISADVFVVTADGVVKSPISFVVGFPQNLNILHVWLRAWEKHYASYIELFNLAIYCCGRPFYEFVTADNAVFFFDEENNVANIGISVYFFYAFGPDLSAGNMITSEVKWC